eukprot:856913_1
MGVFSVAILAASWQISQFSSFIVGDRCDILNAMLKEFLDTSLALDGNDTCYDIKFSLGTDACFLFLAVLLNSLWTQFLLRLGHLALEERTNKVQVVIDQEEQEQDCIEKENLAAESAPLSE